MCTRTEPVAEAGSLTAIIECDEPQSLTPNPQPSNPILGAFRAAALVLLILALPVGAAAADRDALMALYNATDGPFWINSDGWGTTRDIGTWYGVTTNSDGRVTRLDLEDNALDGPIPTELGDLSELKYLNFNFNDLSGSIPEALGNLRNLEYLDLENNFYLSGPIPAALGNLRNLEYLNLSLIPDLSGSIPEALGSLYSLTQLYLSHTGLSGPIPEALGSLTKLRILNLSYNDFDGPIPAKLGRLSRLESLYLESNNFDGSIPAELGNLRSLIHLSLNHNDLSGLIPATLGNLSKLEYLYLNNNNCLSGSIPEALGNLRNLLELDLSNNCLGGTEPIWLEYVPTLNFEGNEFAAPVSLAAGIESPRGLWGDGTTLWVLNQSYGGNDKLYAYELATGTYDSSQDIDIPNQQPILSGLVGDGTTLWIPHYVNWENEEQAEPTALHAYRMSNGSRDSAKDIGLAAENSHPNGLAAAAGGTLWVGDYQDLKLYAYTFSTGVRQRAKDVDLVAGNDKPIGLWTNGTTAWVVDFDDRYVYAYDIATNQRHPGNDIRLYTFNDHPLAAWGDGTTLWVADGTDDVLYAYVLPDTPAPPRMRNRSPQAVDDTAVVSPGSVERSTKATKGAGVLIEVLANDSDPDDDGLTIESVSTPGSGTAEVVGNAIQYTPAGGFTGTETFTYTISDGRGGTATATVTVEVEGLDSTPVQEPPPSSTGGGSGGGSGGSSGSSSGGGGSSGGSSGSSSGGGGGGSGGSGSVDQHGDTPEQATVVTPSPSAPWASSTPGQIEPATDVDYFTLDVPHAGILVVETSGTTDTVGTVWQHGEELGMADSGGERQNFHLSVPVAAGEVVLAVAGNGRTGAYRLETHLVVGYLENPGPDSFQSGLGVVSGWVCAADAVEIELNGEVQPAAYGTERADTQGACGDSDNGFGLLFNWNLLGDGEHEVIALVDGVEFARTTVTVTTLGTEFLRGVAGECTVSDFPSVGESVLVVWQEAQQNFVLAAGSAPTAASRSGIAGVGFLENPSANSFQSGIGVISGWVCAADEVTITLGDLAPQVAGYGTERLDTLDVCGDTDNGFGLLFNWNLLGDGEHEVIATVDGTELARTTVRVTTLGEEFVQDVTGECTVTDFPNPGETVTLTWQESSQNFVITEMQ